MNIMVHLLLAATMVVFAGCGSSTEDDPEKGRAAFKLFNARHVDDKMAVTVENNASQLFSVSMDYAKEASKEADWTEGELWKITYSQDFDIVFDRITPSDTMKIILAVGDDLQQSSPIVFDGPEPEEIGSRQAAVKVVNAMRGDPQQHINDELKLHINNKGDYESRLLSLGESSEGWYLVSTGENSLVEVRDRRNNLQENTTYDILEGRAYVIVIYEESTAANMPKVHFLDVTP
jgi:hypothetical protein